MEVARALSKARRRAGLTQRVLAARTGVSQPTIARIERGKDDPRLGTLERLLNACGETIEVVPQAGRGIDRSEIRELLKMSPRQRLVGLAEEGIALDQLRRARPVR